MASCLHHFHTFELQYSKGKNYFACSENPKGKYRESSFSNCSLLPANTLNVFPIFPQNISTISAPNPILKKAFGSCWHCPLFQAAVWVKTGRLIGSS